MSGQGGRRGLCADRLDPGTVHKPSSPAAFNFRAGLSEDKPWVCGKLYSPAIGSFGALALRLLRFARARAALAASSAESLAPARDAAV